MVVALHETEMNITDGTYTLDGTAGRLRLRVVHDSQAVVFFPAAGPCHLSVEVEARAQVIVCTIHNQTSDCQKSASVALDGKIIWLDVFTRNLASSLAVTTRLQAAGAEAKTYQAFFAEHEGITIQSNVIHEQGNTASTMRARGVLLGEAQGEVNSMIKILKGARNCTAHQRADVLLLGEKARCNALPVLDVEHDAVSCSHGAAIGRLDEEQLYYITARGLSEQVARKIIIAGFLEPIISELPDENLQKQVTQEIEEAYNEKR